LAIASVREQLYFHKPNCEIHLTPHRGRYLPTNGLLGWWGHHVTPY